VSERRIRESNDPDQAKPFLIAEQSEESLIVYQGFLVLTPVSLLRTIQARSDVLQMA